MDQRDNNSRQNTREIETYSYDNYSTRNHNDHDMVTLDIGGKLFTTFFNTLRSKPGTRLAGLKVSDDNFRAKTRTYFFDRNGDIFSHILDYYRTDQLHLPSNLCGHVIKDELKFWGIKEEEVSQCCWRALKELEDEKQTQEMLETLFEDNREKKRGQVERSCNTYTYRHLIWLFLEDPGSSRIAKVWHYFFFAVILLSLAMLCAESVPECRIPPSHNFTIDAQNITNPKIRMYLTTVAHPVVVWIDSLCLLFFTIELAIRFYAWPNRWRFMCYFYNIIDIFSVLPMLTLVIIDCINSAFWYENDLYFAYSVLSLSAVFRAVRVLKLVKHNRGFQIIYLALKASCEELFLLMLLMLIGTMIFSTLIYFAEFGQDDTFKTIPIGFWWSIVTMTTVGYGDRHPTSLPGYIVGSMCAFAGILATGLPIPVIANSFTLYYTYAQMKIKRRKLEESGNQQHPPTDQNICVQWEMTSQIERTNHL